MTPEGFLAANGIVFAGFLVRGFTGFGAVLFVLPLLVLWLPVKLVVPLLAVLGIANGGWLALRCRKQVDRRELGLLLGGALPGMLLGMLLFRWAADDGLRRGLGALLVLVGLWLGWRAGREKGTWPPAAGVGAGLLAGLLGALFGVSGPPPVAYLTQRRLESISLRATLLLFILAVDGARSAAYAFGGTVNGSIWLAGLALLPASMLGSWCGERLQVRVAEETFRRFLGLALAAMGLVLLLT